MKQTTLVIAIRNKKLRRDVGPSPEVSAARAEAAKRQRDFYAQLERWRNGFVNLSYVEFANGCHSFTAILKRESRQTITA